MTHTSALSKQTAARMRALFKDVSGYATDGIGPAGRRLRRAKALVYGELTAVGIRQLIRAAGLGNGDRFVDLGSGVGKIVLQVALEVPDVTCLGLEIDAQRHEHASAALRRAEEKGWLAPGRCMLRHEDARSADLQGATVLFANSTCFEPALLSALGRRVADLPRPVTFATLRELPPRTARLFEPVGDSPCHTSWSKHVTVHVYRRSLESS
jgi:Histone methylation protein DOT1